MERREPKKKGFSGAGSEWAPDLAEYWRFLGMVAREDHRKGLDIEAVKPAGTVTNSTVSEVLAHIRRHARSHAEGHEDGKGGRGGGGEHTPDEGIA